MLTRFFRKPRHHVGNHRGFLNNRLQRRPQLWRRIIIPKEMKWEIRDQLDQSNITYRVLFPGLEGLTAWLRRHYSLRN